MTVKGTIEIVAAVIRDAAGRVLLVRKRGTTAFMQPGGKRDAGEDDITALARELCEELGCQLVRDSVHPLGEFDAVSANEPGWRVRASLYETVVTGAISCRKPRSTRSTGSTRRHQPKYRSHH